MLPRSGKRFCFISPPSLFLVSLWSYYCYFFSSQLGWWVCTAPLSVPGNSVFVPRLPAQRLLSPWSFSTALKHLAEFFVVFFAAVQGFWEIPLGQLPPLSLPTGGNTSPWISTATSSRVLHPSHIFISSLASLDLLLSGLKWVFPAGALSCWEDGWSWSSMDPMGSQILPKGGCSAGCRIPSAKHQWFHSSF